MKIIMQVKKNEKILTIYELNEGYMVQSMKSEHYGQTFKFNTIEEALDKFNMEAKLYE